MTDTIAIGSDHGGFTLKNEIIAHLSRKGIKVKDFGIYSNERADYPDIAVPVALAVSSGEYGKGILICGTGIGISISANKVPGIRAALCCNSYMARMSREHNDANILALGGRVTGAELALDIVDAWLCGVFQGGRHKVRIDKMAEFEKKFDAGKIGN